MPQLVSELIKGSTFERSAENGILADSAIRQWRVLLSSPSESFDITAPPPLGTGVKIGDPLNPDDPTSITCVSMSVAADGDNRMTRIITARYQTIAGQGGGQGGNEDPGKTPPDERLSVVSISTSIGELASMTAIKVGSNGSTIGSRKAMLNAAGDRYESVFTKPEPISVITVEQFDWPTDPTKYIEHVGRVNSNAATWRGLAIPKRTLLFRGMSMRPENLYWGAALYRGWMTTYEFVLRMNVQAIGDPPVSSACGWDNAVIEEGFHYLAGGKKQRFMVQIPNTTEFIQSAQPMALNLDGTDRGNAQPIVTRWGHHEEADFSTVLSHLRLAPPPP